MTDPRQCPQCDSALPSDAPPGVCPACLAAAGSPTPTTPPQPDHLTIKSPASEPIEPQQASEFARVRDDFLTDLGVVTLAATDEAL